MKILAIETSCDETAAAVVEDGWKVLSNVITSSLDLHQITGGVVPEVAARAHIEAIIPVVEQALFAGEDDHPRPQNQSHSRLQSAIDSIDAIAVTSEPGLITSLLVGIETAKWLAYLWKKPLIKVNHVRGHVYANWLERDPEKDPIQFPVLCLSVSGGHNELILLKSHSEWEIIGESQDDAAGEAFDKVARILGFGYPGGPEIEKHALRHSEQSSTVIPSLSKESLGAGLSFPRAWLNQNQSNKWDGTSFDFSFSGLKSEVLREVEHRRGKSRLAPTDIQSLSDPVRSEIAFAFQEAVFDVLVTKLIGAAEKYGAKEIHIAGGVSANKRLRSLIEQYQKTAFAGGVGKARAKSRGSGVLSPFGESQREAKGDKAVAIRWPKKMVYCTDNAAMIGAAARFSLS